MEKKTKELKTGVRLNIRKPPKAEVPKNIYTRKVKHKKGCENEKSWPSFFYSGTKDTVNTVFSDKSLKSSISVP
ncbi:MAG TPA: hypothetical protein P5120_17650 [Spirochaetota bacterium]|nr:hypothetical protein [Spirochaetota bacterium]